MLVCSYGSITYAFRKVFGNTEDTFLRDLGKFGNGIRPELGSACKKKENRLKIVLTKLTEAPVALNAKKLRKNVEKKRGEDSLM